jgi:C_GCAxxG_C_C family probable redox protein
MSKKNLAEGKFHSGYNCAQSVLVSFVPQLNIDENTALQISSGFGAGMGRTQKTCGALTGAYMVLSLKYGKQHPADDVPDDKVVDLIQDFTQKFEDEHGFTNCRDLLKVDLKTKAGQDEFQKKDLHNKVCTLCVNSAVSLLEEVFEKNK